MSFLSLTCSPKLKPDGVQLFWKTSVIEIDFPGLVEGRFYAILGSRKDLLGFAVDHEFREDLVQLGSQT